MTIRKTIFISHKILLQTIALPAVIYGFLVISQIANAFIFLSISITRATNIGVAKSRIRSNIITIATITSFILIVATVTRRYIGLELRTVREIFNHGTISIGHFLVKTS